MDDDAIAQEMKEICLKIKKCRDENLMEEGRAALEELEALQTRMEDAFIKEMPEDLKNDLDSPKAQAYILKRSAEFLETIDKYV